MPWIDVTESERLASGQIVTVDREDGDIVVWRTTAGKVVACDARCPHQWSHLGIAGAVDGEEIVCLSHFWRFDSEGGGSKLSASGRRDEKSSIVTFSVREQAGRIEINVPE
ncbi:MAG: Rieske 2Fe-2S domain-containing protein [Actinobacteria bacterium]|nr:Rieske 2Fe-2S domain-containing protein [Actinomycetota bacterium]